jgi:NTP pyrophosphatase (non-canonical NTP hydrolase)
MPKTQRDSYDQMLAAVAAFHRKHQFKERGGEEMLYRIAIMSEELGEIAEAVTKGKSLEELAEEVADLFILLIGTAIAQDFDLKQAFWDKMEKLDKRQAKMVNGRVRVSEFRDKKDRQGS